MREVGKTIKINKYVEVEEIVTKEKINFVSINYDEKIVTVNIILLNSTEHVVGEKNVLILDENYDLFFSNDVFFDVGKQEGSYREIDLWKMIDKIFDQQNQTAH